MIQQVWSGGTSLVSQMERPPATKFWMTWSRSFNSTERWFLRWLLVRSAVKKFTFWIQEGNFNSPNEAYVDYTLTFKFGSVSGQGRLVGTKHADQFTFDHFESFGGKTADKIIGFNDSHGDTIGVSATACPSLLDSEEITFAKAHSAKEVRRLSRQDIDFVYFQDKGRLFFNGNGSDKGWGEPDEGGLFAFMHKRPELSADDFTLLA